MDAGDFIDEGYWSDVENEGNIFADIVDWLAGLGV
jgi:hypothetical protein